MQNSNPNIGLEKLHLSGGSVLKQNTMFILSPAGHTEDDPTVIRLPNPVAFLKSCRCLNVKKGVCAGMFVVVLAIVNLGVFYGLEVEEDGQISVRRLFHFMLG